MTRPELMIQAASTLMSIQPIRCAKFTLYYRLILDIHSLAESLLNSELSRQSSPTGRKRSGEHSIDYTIAHSSKENTRRMTNGRREA